MRKGIEERGPIAAWLIGARGSFREPGAERSWTVEDFLRTMQAETGWAPTRTTYARWESGAVRPEDANLRRVEAFYAARGLPGLSEPAPRPAVLSLEERAVIAAERQAAAAERQATALEIIALRLSAGPTPDPADEAMMQAWAMAVRASQSPRPDPVRDTPQS